MKIFLWLLYMIIDCIFKKCITFSFFFSFTGKSRTCNESSCWLYTIDNASHIWKFFIQVRCFPRLGKKSKFKYYSKYNCRTINKTIANCEPHTTTILTWTFSETVFGFVNINIKVNTPEKKERDLILGRSKIMEQSLRGR